MPVSRGGSSLLWAVALLVHERYHGRFERSTIGFVGPALGATRIGEELSAS